MTDEHERLCIFCHHFEFYPGEPGYSEYTPGADTVIRCRLGFWSTSTYWDENDYRRGMLQAKTCQRFQWVPLVDVLERSES